MDLHEFHPVIEQILGMVGGLVLYPWRCTPPPRAPFHLRGLECSRHLGGARRQEGGTALHSPGALGAASATAPNLQAATAFQINSLTLLLCPCPPVPLAQVLPLGSVSVGPLCPLICAHLPSLASLASSPSFSHSLSLLVTLCLFFSSPFVSRTCPCSPSQAHFLSSLPSSSRLLVCLLGPVRNWQPPSPKSPSTYKTCLIASLLGKKKSK